MKKFWDEEWTGVIGMLAGCFLVGMAVGALFGNLAYPYRGQEADLLGVYLFNRLKEEKIATRSYFYYLLEQRMRGYLFFALAGLTGAARLSAVGGMLVMGFLAGAGGSMGVLQQGIQGALFFLGANFPQAILYIPSMLFLLGEIYRQNGKIWRKSKGMVKEYVLTVFLCILGGMGGILLETYGNPVFLSWMADKM